MSDEDLPPPPSNSGPSAHLNTLRGTTQVRQANYVSEELETLLDVEPEDDSIQPPEVGMYLYSLTDDSVQRIYPPPRA
ncbi:hypothetical protein PHLGIDRAFT_20159 [Phlebiopsis gigantea 11061_1 CR5-6]|uniref:Uncharacterized protein n=1 Tax=Phlebiopsis gigantea (strain 11061_1 CR5-6) TaxID=745531 RepID=A0A0C3RT54_PHLG1|nr:hypothetical protein PHLGIDRAFT_20159 [Phlebiopsis gigantea 11061_1 CR5-6]